MASFSASLLRFQPSLHHSKTSLIASRHSLKLVSVSWAKIGFPSLKTNGFRVSCAAKPATVEKVCDIVRKQLALTPEKELTPATKFSELGADSLDTVEIVMGLEEEFGISVEEENSQNITTVQEAADLIENLLEKKAGAGAGAGS
ncbi:hypothetical protein JCGZ_26383 [Jatropha curcas]|uniref:Acyl carrier protein n=1 Tax=Jatropha curcas TaxID=180498 RepID=A0A067JFD1_JATCU|nr:acyl carrier protein 1, chloroplastic isoform X2 [Jatropha curcas]KDP22552.1 hypothetical protein JCGZ_26383 [Jatropha curcas]